MNQLFRIRVLGALAGLVCSAVGCGGYDSSGNGPALMIAPDALVGSHLVDGSSAALRPIHRPPAPSSSN